MAILAHAADWIASLVYLVPIVLVAGALLFAYLRERRRGRESDYADRADRIGGDQA